MKDITTTDAPDKWTATPAAAAAGCSTATLKRYASLGLVKALRTVSGVHIFELGECRRLRAEREARRRFDSTPNRATKNHWHLEPGETARQSVTRWQCPGSDTRPMTPS